MAKSGEQDQTGGGGGGGGGGVPNPGQTEEQRVAAQRLASLETQASEAVSAANDAKRDAAAAKGDLERAEVELAATRGENERLRAQLAAFEAANQQRDTLPTLPVDLPRNAKQLTESVTIESLAADGKPRRANAKRGSVVIVGKLEDATELQGRIGQVASVYAVSKEHAAELAQMTVIR